MPNAISIQPIHTTSTFTRNTCIIHHYIVKYIFLKMLCGHMPARWGYKYPPHLPTHPFLTISAPNWVKLCGLHNRHVSSRVIRYVSDFPVARCPHLGVIYIRFISSCSPTRRAMWHPKDQILDLWQTQYYNRS